MDFEDLRHQIKGFADKSHGRGATTEEVSLAAAAISVVFSRSYIQFLREFGWATFAHEELYGLGPDVPLHLELVKSAFVERNATRPRMPPHLVPVMNDGTGNHYCLDTAKMSNDECPIVLWDHELGENQEPGVVGETFGAWLRELLSDLESQ